MRCSVANVISAPCLDFYLFDYLLYSYSHHLDIYTMPKDTELYDLLGVAPEATDIEYAFQPSSLSTVARSKLII